MTNELQHLVALQTTYRKRLHILELQSAQFGISTPPHITIEIEDIREKLSELESKIATINKNLVSARGEKMQNAKQSMSTAAKDGDFCEVIGGTHAGKSGTARGIKISKSGSVTITIVRSNGERFKTLAKNVVVKKSHTA